MKRYQRLLRKIGLFQVRNPYLTVILVLLISIALYGGVADVRTVASLEQMMPEDVEEIKAFNTLRDNGLGQDMIAVIISLDDQATGPGKTMDVRDQDVVAAAEDLKQALSEETDILEVYAASDVISHAAGQPVEDIPGRQYEGIISNEQVQGQLDNFISEDATTMIVLATTDVSADDQRMQLLATRVKEIVGTATRPAGVEYQMTGTPIIQQRLGELIGQDRTNTQRISTLLVFVIVMLLFGTFTSSLVPLAIVTLSVNWLYGIMGYAGLPISTLAGGVAAMVIGIGIDYAIHLMNRFKYERKHGGTREQAIVAAVQNTGTALTGAAIATILAFLAFLIGSMPEMNRFGLLMAIGVSSAFLLSIFVLPALLIIEEKVIRLLSKRMHFGVEGEYMLCDPKEVVPDDYRVEEPSVEDLETLKKRYKIAKKRKK